MYYNAKLNLNIKNPMVSTKTGVICYNSKIIEF
jgi:hypothetical protein